MENLARSLLAAALLLLFPVVGLAQGDALAEFMEGEAVFPIVNEEVPGLKQLTDEIAVPDWEFLFEGEACFGFTPNVKFIPNSGDFVISTWCELGGWEMPGRSGVSRYTPRGRLVARASVQDEGEDPMTHGLGWDLTTFSDGGVAAAGPGKVIDLELPWPVPAMRLFDARLSHVGPLVSAFEPELLAGNDPRDCHFPNCPVIGEAFLRPRMVTLPATQDAGERFVLAVQFASAEMQKAQGLTDPNPALDDVDGDGVIDSPPGAKTYFRVFERDGTPVGPSRMAFSLDGTDEENWTRNHAHVDVAPRANGRGFFLVGSGVPALANGDSQPIYFYDRDGNQDGDPVSVVDPSLFEVQGGFPPPEVSQANGIYALASAINVHVRQFGLTLFEEVDRPARVRILKRTFNAFRQQDLSLAGIRESDLAQDPQGNCFLMTRGEYVDPDGNPLGPDDSDDMITVAAISRDGEHLSAPFVPYDESGYPNSQRDPSLAASDYVTVYAYLSAAPEFEMQTFGGLNVFVVHNNPFNTGTPIEDFVTGEAVRPIPNEEVPGLAPLSEETAVPDWDFLFEGLSCFGFTPNVKFIPGSDDFVISTWCELGGWEMPGRSGVSRYSPQGQLIARRSVQDDGEDPMTHGLGWDLTTFSDGGVAAAGPGRVLDLELPWPVPAMRLFDAGLNHVGPLVSAFEPELLAGNDPRDCHFTNCPEIGEAFLRPRLVTLPATDGGAERFVLAVQFASAEMQKAQGLVDPNPALDDLDGNGVIDFPPGGKIYFRVFERDGTPVGASHMAFSLSGSDNEKWRHVQAHVDVAPRANGRGFFLVGTGVAALPNGDRQPIYLYDRDGNQDGDPIGVVDPGLFSVQGGFPPPEVSQANGIYALASTISINVRQFGLTLFEEVDAPERIRIIKPTFNAFRQQDLSLAGIRESDLAQDPRGNCFLMTRGEYVDPDGNPIGPDDSDDMITVALISSEGEHHSAPFVPYDESGYPNSQRDPSLAASENASVYTYLSAAPGFEMQAFGGLNVFISYNNPFTDTGVVGPFARGDCNLDGTANVADGIFLLNFLFGGGSAPLCAAACDNNGDGGLDITTVVFMFNYLFAGGGDPPPPLECGISSSPSDVELGCERPEGCL